MSSSLIQWMISISRAGAALGRAVPTVCTSADPRHRVAMAVGARAAMAALVLCGMLCGGSACAFARRRELRGGDDSRNFTLPPGHPFVPSADLMAALRRIARRDQESGNSDEYEVIRAEIRYILENPVDPVTGLPDPFYDDGSYAPIALRLAWHAAADWDPDPPPGEPRGGSQGGASMRFEPGRSYEENRGLELPILFLEPIRLLHPQLSYSDLWCDKPRAPFCLQLSACIYPEPVLVNSSFSCEMLMATPFSYRVLAGYEAVETLGGPHIEFRPGRIDVDEGGANCPPEERLPGKKTPFLRHFTLTMIIVHQDRLGTNIGKTQKTRAFLQPRWTPPNQFAPNSRGWSLGQGSRLR